MISDMISYTISYMILDMISCIKMQFSYFLCPAAADPRPAQRADETDDDSEPDRPMDFVHVYRHRHEGRSQDSIPTVEAHAVLR